MDRLVEKKHRELIETPEELIYRSCYAPIDLAEMLQSANQRSKIRRLPAAQLFFSIKELDDKQLAALLPHLTENQWTTILDLDLWDRDRLRVGVFLGWEKAILETPDPVARKIVRATDPEILELAFCRDLDIIARLEDDEFEGEPEGEVLNSPDGSFLIVLPSDPDTARIYRLLLLKLFQLDSQTTHLLLQESRARTASELEEEAYANRKRRIEDLGFQDYYDAIEIYTPRSLSEELPLKRWEDLVEQPFLPVTFDSLGRSGPLLLFKALAGLSTASELEPLVEELFFVCNKILSADRVSPGSPELVKASIRKALTGLNLGLSLWSRENVQAAIQGLRSHYLVSFFQVGFGALSELREKSRHAVESCRVPPGGYLEAALEGFLLRYPVLTEQKDGKISQRFLENPEDLRWAEKVVDQAIAN